MPKIFGTNLLGILAATIAFYLIGWLWFGGIFMERWAELTGTPTDGGMDPAVMVKGFLITLAQVLGLSYILQHAGASTLQTCLKVCGIVFFLIALPLIAYNVIYEGRHKELFLIDASHILVGYLVAGAVLSFFRGKDAIDPT